MLNNIIWGWICWTTFRAHAIKYFGGFHIQYNDKWYNLFLLGFNTISFHYSILRSWAGNCFHTSTSIRGFVFILYKRCFRFTLNKVKLAINYSLSKINLNLIAKIQTQSIKADFRIPSINEIFPLLYTLFTLCIVPLFYFNLYMLATVTGSNIHDMSLYMSLISFLFSCSTFFLLFVIGYNIYYVNSSNNIWIILQMFRIGINMSLF